MPASQQGAGIFIGQGVLQIFHNLIGIEIFSGKADFNHKNHVVRFVAEKLINIHDSVHFGIAAVGNDGIQNGFLHGQPVFIQFFLQLLLFGQRRGEGGVYLIHIAAARKGLVHQLCEQPVKGQ